MHLANRQCEPCRAGTSPLTEAERNELMAELVDWRIEQNRLVKTIKVSGFKKPMQLANKIAELAERVQHHPDLHIRWGSLQITIWTHAIDNLSIADFILAAKVDELVG
jgi:4a-hydroxytetrahydrobiopterin dehydratase